MHLVPYETFAEQLHGIRYRTVLRMADRAQFPPYVRFAPGSTPLFNAQAVERWIADRNAIVSEINQ